MYLDVGNDDASDFVKRYALLGDAAPRLYITHTVLENGHKDERDDEGEEDKAKVLRDVFWRRPPP